MKKKKNQEDVIKRSDWDSSLSKEISCSASLIGRDIYFSTKRMNSVVKFVPTKTTKKQKGKSNAVNITRPSPFYMADFVCQYLQVWPQRGIQKVRSLPSQQLVSYNLSNSNS